MAVTNSSSPNLGLQTDLGDHPKGITPVSQFSENYHSLRAFDEPLYEFSVSGKHLKIDGNASRRSFFV